MVNDIKPGPSVLETFRHLASLVGTLVIDDDGDSIVPECLWNARKHGRQSLLCAVGGDHNGLLHRGYFLHQTDVAPSGSRQTSLIREPELEQREETRACRAENFSLPEFADGLTFLPLFPCQSQSHAARRANRLPSASRSPPRARCLRTRGGRRHLLQCKSSKRKRKLAKSVLVHDSDAARIKANLPFA